MTETPLRVGVVGAGPWAELVHAPMFAAGPETVLSGIWARRPEAAQALAARHGSTAFAGFEELLADSDAVAFAVPPSVQAELAAQAARAGKAILLEKPVAADLAAAMRLADIVEASGVTSMITLTYRYASGVREFLAEAKTKQFRGGRSLFLTNAYLGGPFATEWRLASGSLLDTGPHAIDLLEAAVGPVVAVNGVHGTGEWTAVTLEHENGATTQVSLCSHTATDPLRIEMDLYNEHETVRLDVTAAMGEAYGEAILQGTRPLSDAEAFQTLRREFAASARSGRVHELDIRHGIRLQRIVAAIQRALDTPGQQVG